MNKMNEEYKLIDLILYIFEMHNLSLGRIISYSKSAYNRAHPENFTLFNANIFLDDGKVWWGDIDLTKDKDKLLEISKVLNKDLYILNEMDGRFSNENREDFKEVAIWNTKSGLIEDYKDYVNEDSLTLKTPKK